jgi:hypothetical protein
VGHCFAQKKQKKTKKTKKKTKTTKKELWVQLCD